MPLQALVVALALVGCGLEGELSSPEDYDRRDWKHWVDEDRDCQDTRQEVLVSESVSPVKFETERECRVSSGEWVDPYTGETFTDPSVLDIDHVVALRDAHDSGGFSWSAERRREFANDLSDERSLRAVYRGANRSKGSRGPDLWLPKNPEFRCQYILEYSQIKSSWGLRSSDSQTAVLAYMMKICEDGEVPHLPQ
jgi:hypothetical protein